jgi:TetR/AcrR family transcriptional regulator, transcriptional repressor for nem operon
VARPREFSEETALKAAAHRFWMYGYEATSVRDLAQEMGITQASLYNAFGDKRSLFQSALVHYVKNHFGEREKRIEITMGPRAAIEAFLQEIIEHSVGDTERKGCMLVNSALEIASHDPDLRFFVASQLERIEDFFLRCVVAGQQAAEISSAQSAGDLVKILLGVHLGIRVLARSRPERALLEGVVRPVLALLDVSPEISRVIVSSGVGRRKSQ